MQTYGEVSLDLSYVRKVYLWLLVGVLMTSSTAWMALNLGSPVPVQYSKEIGTVMAPPLVAAFLLAPWVVVGIYFGLAFSAILFRGVEGLSKPLYFAFTAFSGLFIGPALFAAQVAPAYYHTISGHPIRDAFFLTLSAFVGLTVYAFHSTDDFQWLRGFLWIGLWVVLAAFFLAAIFGSSALSLAVSSVAVLLFAGYVVYDTAKILRNSDQDDPIGDALNLYLDVINIFINLIQILSSRKD